MQIDFIMAAARMLAFICWALAHESMAKQSSYSYNVMDSGVI